MLQLGNKDYVNGIPYKAFRDFAKKNLLVNVDIDDFMELSEYSMARSFMAVQYKHKKK